MLEVQAKSQIKAREVTVVVKGLIVGLQHHMRVQEEAGAERPDSIARLRPRLAVGGEACRYGGEARRDALIRRSHVVALPANEGTEPISAPLPQRIGTLNIVAEKFGW